MIQLLFDEWGPQQRNEKGGKELLKVVGTVLVRKGLRKEKRSFAGRKKDVDHGVRT